MFATMAEAYDRYIGRYSRQLAPRLAAAARVAPGTRVVEVGCGPGSLTAVLAELVGPGAVVAVEASQDFADTCRARVPAAEVLVGRAELLPFRDGEFDTALAQLVVNLLDEPVAGVREMARVTRPGGAVAGCLWADDGMPLLQSFWDAAAEVEPAAVARLGESGRVGLGRHELAELWEEAGLGKVAVSGLQASETYEDFDDLWLPIAAGVGRSGALYRTLGPDARSALRVGFHRRLGAPEGPFTLTARAWCAVGWVARDG